MLYGRTYKVWLPHSVKQQQTEQRVPMETAYAKNQQADRKTWFSMWFLGAIVTFGLAFFPLFNRLVEGRNKHFCRELDLEQKISSHLKSQGKPAPETTKSYKEMNAYAWAASIILIVPAFVILYLLSKDLVMHEHQMDSFLAKAFPTRMFMTQTIPIKKYAVLTIITLGVGGIYWLYKLVNLYNAHYKAQWYVEKEIEKIMEQEKCQAPVKNADS